MYSYSVTALCESNLERYLESLPLGSPLQFMQVTSRFCRQLLSGLSYLHQCGVYHGSLKVSQHSWPTMTSVLISTA